MLLTFSRAPLAIAGAVCVVVHTLTPVPAILWSALGLMLASALTDLFDGFLARRWGVTSKLGALADPLMDKVFYAVTLPVAVFVAMYNEDTRHALLLLTLDVVSALRDQWVSFLRTVGTEYGADVRANWSGKLRTFIGFPIIVFAHLQLGLECLRLRSVENEGVCMFNRELVFGLETLVIVLTIISAISYTLRYLPYLRKAGLGKSGR